MTVYGPYDFNYRRLIPSICLNLFHTNNKKLKYLIFNKKKFYIY